MYNEIIGILVCIFAVYGAYALLRVLGTLFARKPRYVIGVRAGAMEPEALAARIEPGMYAAETQYAAEKTPVLLFADEDAAANAPEELEVYVRYQKTEEQWQRREKKRSPER